MSSKAKPCSLCDDDLARIGPRGRAVWMCPRCDTNAALAPPSFDPRQPPSSPEPPAPPKEPTP